MSNPHHFVQDITVKKAITLKDPSEEGKKGDENNLGMLPAKQQEVFTRSGYLVVLIYTAAG